MRRLKNISLFRPILLAILSAFIGKIWLIFIICLYFYFADKKELAAYILLCLLLICTDRYRIDFIPFGIVERCNANSCIVDKLLYKAKITDNDTLSVGDVVFFSSEYKPNSILDELKKNICFYGYDFKYLFHFRARSILLERIDGLEVSSDYIKYVLFKIYPENGIDSDLISGLYAYYLLKRINDRSDTACIVAVIFLSVFIYCDVKFYLIIMDCILDNMKIERKEKIAIKLYVICLLNMKLLYNYSIIIPLLFTLFSCIDLNIDFELFYSFMSSLLFGETNIVESLLFGMNMKIKEFIYIASLFVAFFGVLEKQYMKLMKAYEYAISLIGCFSIRGSISIVGVSVFIICYGLIKNRNKYAYCLILCLIIMSPLNRPFLSISFIDVGQGDAILVKEPLYGKKILIDTGSDYNYYKLERYLKRYGIYCIDYLIITHDDSDHNGNIDNLNRDFRIRNIIEKGTDIKTNNLVFEYLDLGENDNDNDNSLVYYLDVNGHDFLFTGDISSDIEKRLISLYGNRNIDILKVSHHGSKNSTSDYFISNTLPEIAIISTNGQYGHPSKRVIDTLEKYGTELYTTAIDGNICFVFTRLMDLLKTGNGDFAIMKK